MRDWLALIRRLAIATFALVCVVAGNYMVRPGVPTPPAVILLAAEHEAELHRDVSPVMRLATLTRATDPVRALRTARRSVRLPVAVLHPRSLPAPHGEPRGPPARA